MKDFKLVRVKFTHILDRGKIYPIADLLVHFGQYCYEDGSVEPRFEEVELSTEEVAFKKRLEDSKVFEAKIKGFTAKEDIELLLQNKGVDFVYYCSNYGTHYFSFSGKKIRLGDHTTMRSMFADLDLRNYHSFDNYNKSILDHFLKTIV
jgi:hypothetical protein